MSNIFLPFSPVISIGEIDNDKPKYFPAPPIIKSIYKYQTVNGDGKLQRMVTERFLSYILEWLDTDGDFKKFRKLRSKFESDIGYDIVYKLLRLFVKRGDTNWYDLDIQRELVKDYLAYKLEEYI
jgi:hypothetical protein